MTSLILSKVTLSELEKLSIETTLKSVFSISSIDSNSALYFFSAMAQSLAALFALTFIAVNKKQTVYNVGERSFPVHAHR